MKTVNEKEMNYYYCYSPNQKKWLQKNGLPYLVSGVNQDTGKRYWGYVRGRVLELLLDEYSQGLNK